MADKKNGNALWDKFDKMIDTKALADDVKEAEENGTTGTFREIPHGDYEVEVNKLELDTTKDGTKMMVKAWFKIVTGDYKGSLIFMNQVVEQTFQIHIANEVLRDLAADTGVEIKFETYKQYGNLIMDVFEAIGGNYEFALKYGENSKGYNTFEITEVFPLED